MSNKSRKLSIDLNMNILYHQLRAFSQKTRLGTPPSSPESWAHDMVIWYWLADTLFLNLSTELNMEQQGKDNACLDSTEKKKKERYTDHLLWKGVPHAREASLLLIVIVSCSLRSSKNELEFYQNQREYDWPNDLSYTFHTGTWRQIRFPFYKRHCFLI